MDSLEIRPMKNKDLKFVLDIENIAFNNPWSKKAFVGELANQYAYYLVGIIDEIVVGYVGAWLVLDEGHITTLAISKDYQRRGIATKLLRKLFQDMKEDNINKATLEVRFSNKPAESLYKKEGFASVGVRKNYYSDNQEDALIMWKQL